MIQRNDWRGDGFFDPIKAAVVQIFCLAILISIAPTVLGQPAAAPGVLIDVGGYRLHIACEGYGTPTVVFDVGLGGHSLEWRAVVNEARAFTRVCTYDRAGYGWSDIGPLPRTSSTIANELYLLLEAVDYEKPFVLVGHSFGGYNMQLFARRYPYLVAGLVLVDSSHATQVERFKAPPFNLNTAPSSRWGTVKFGNPPRIHKSLSVESRRLVSYQMRRWRTRRTLGHEFLGFRDSGRELRSAQALTAMPVVVLSRGKRVWPHNRRGDLLEQLWMKLQAELAALSPASAHIVAANSGHQVHMEQPKLVAYSIAVIIDRHRLEHAGDRDAERQELSGRGGIDFRSAAWLRDTLLMQTGVDRPLAGLSSAAH